MTIASLKEASHAFAISLMEHLVVPTFVIDTSHRVIIWNKACERLTGIKSDEVIGTDRHWSAFYESRRRCLADALVDRKTEILPQLYAAHTIFGDSTLGLHAETWCVMPQIGKELYLAVDAGPIFDEDGHLIAVVETLRDITDQKIAQMELELLARRDSLTGLANRRAFDEALQLEWRRAQRERQPLSLLIGDVDNFKLFNDTYGHQQGDVCLKAVAGAIKDQLRRPADLVARYGGEEFVAILPVTTGQGALDVAERVREAVMAMGIPHAANGKYGVVTMSIGLMSAVPDGELPPDTLVGFADHALYDAKRNGRNRVVLSLHAED